MPITVPLARNSTLTTEPAPPSAVLSLAVAARSTTAPGETARSAAGEVKATDGGGLTGAVEAPKTSSVAAVKVPPAVLLVPLSSVIFSLHVPDAFSPQLRTVMKVQLGKLSPESLCTSARRLTVPDGEVSVIFRLPRAV